MKPVLFDRSCSNYKLVLEEDTDGQNKHAAPCKHVNRTYEAKNQLT
jgi:hypothetical protein